MARYRNINWKEHADEACNYFGSIGSIQVPRFEVQDPKYPLDFPPSAENNVVSYILVSSNDSNMRRNSPIIKWRSYRKKTYENLQVHAYQNRKSTDSVQGQYKAQGFYMKDNDNEVFWFVHFDPYAEAKIKVKQKGKRNQYTANPEEVSSMENDPCYKHFFDF